ncbi:hypothetical protein H5395_17465 [Paracoccus sp. MC1854]|uniref:hypothetical protein n=1 Tax=Paracoccus sp. MC1854 TaxID=2760306 RepID=UPI001603868B|nr:hypothetical protein [Paracoccus sp. MC1854]MBB1493244.1 hypothetical protein [Paracoccus sp. MC1854]
MDVSISATLDIDQDGLPMDDPITAPGDIPLRASTLHIVAVHGVGSPEPGSLLPQLMQAYALCTGRQANFTRREIATSIPLGNGTGAFHYVGVETVSEGGRTILWDANWADLHRAPSGWLARIPFTMGLLVATVAYAGTKSAPGRLLHLFFSGILIWLVLPAMISLWSASLKSNWLFGLFALVLAFVTFWVAGKLRRIDPTAVHAGWFWAALVLVLAGIHFFRTDWLAPAAFGAAAMRFQALLTLFGPLLVLLVLVFGRNGARWRVHLSLVGLLALSMALATGLLAVILWANLYAADQLAQHLPSVVYCDEFREWDAAYVAALPYDVVHVEAATSTATMSVGVLFMTVMASWAIGTFLRQSSNTGAVLRVHMSWISIIVVLLFLVVSTFIALDMTGIFGETRPSVRPPDATGQTGSSQSCPVAKDGLVGIYGRSALRMLPFALMLLFRPVRIALDVMADVLHYLRDPRQQQASLSSLLASLEGGDTRIAIIGHSQGSVIAIDTVLADPGRFPSVMRVATTGSPFCTLYGWLLDNARIPARSGQIRWNNYWRGSDFVGGRIGSGDFPVNVPIRGNFRQHHINYWIEDEVMMFALGARSDHR